MWGIEAGSWGLGVLIWLSFAWIAVVFTAWVVLHRGGGPRMRPH